MILLVKYFVLCLTYLTVKLGFTSSLLQDPGLLMEILPVLCMREKKQANHSLALKAFAQKPLMSPVLLDHNTWCDGFQNMPTNSLTLLPSESEV